MNKLIIGLFCMLFALDAWAQQNPAPASWQGPRTSGDGVMFLNTGQGVTIQDAARSTAKPIFPLGLDLTGGTFTVTSAAQPSPNNIWFNVRLAIVNGSYNDVINRGINNSFIGSYAVNRTGSGLIPNTGIYTTVGGAGQAGGFVNLDSATTVNANTGDTADSYFNSGRFTTTITANAGGTPGNEMGEDFGLAAIAILGSGGTNFVSVHGMEIDYGIYAGATANFENGLQLVLANNNAVAATKASEALLITSQTSVAASNTVGCGVCLMGWQGYSPLAASAMFIGVRGHGGSTAYPQVTIQDGIDLHLMSFTGFAWRGPNDTSDIDNSGNFITSAGFQAVGVSPATIGNVTHGVGFRVSDSGGTTVNIAFITPGQTGQPVGFNCGGPLSDAAVTCAYSSKGTGLHQFFTGGGRQVTILNIASAVDWVTLNGSIAGSPGIVQVGAGGSDTNIDVALVPKGSGVLRIGNTQGVACAAGTVSTATMVVTGGLVTHC